MMINRQRRIPVAVAPLEAFLARVRERFGLPEDAVTVCLVSDTAIARWNKMYRGKRAATDVLSFPINGNGLKQEKQMKLRRQTKGSARPAAASYTSHDSSPYLGDICIAPETARRNARRFRRTLPEELRILILHGVLHLLGYDHEADHGEMDRLERRVRRELGLR
jgi:probable rRNA maturation factor